MTIKSYNNNPFWVGNPIQDPANFVGRKAELRRIAQALLGKTPPQNISLRGERRIGKTSLLRYLAHPQALPESHIPVYFDFQSLPSEAGITEVGQALARAIAEQIERRYPNGQDEAKQFLATITEFLPSPELLFGTGFGSALDHLTASDFKFHFLFDEFDQTVLNPNLDNSFYGALRSWTTRAENISYIIATRQGLSELQKYYDQISSPLFNIFSSITLSPFQQNEVDELIFNYFERAGLKPALAEKLCEQAPFLYDVTGYHPFFLQTLCYHLCNQLNKADWPLGQAKQEALQAFEEDVAPHFDYYWQISNQEEQRLMHSLAGITGRQVNWEDHPITKPLIEKLKNRSLVIQAGKHENEWRLFSSVFGDWIKNNVPPPPIPVKAPRGAIGQAHFYIERSSDQKAREAIEHSDGVTIAIKAPREMGKSSLLMRLINAAEKMDRRVVYFDFRLLFTQATAIDSETFFRRFCSEMSEALNLEDRIAEFWRTTLTAINNCTRYVERYILPEINSPLMLAMDGVDLIEGSIFRSDFFGMLRSWHNKRSNPITPIWKQLSLVLSTSTEPSLFIENLDQSPFNVGTEIELTDFTLAEVTQLNDRYSLPLNREQVQKLMNLLHGHPYLAHLALYLVAAKHLTAADLFTHTAEDEGPFGEHLHRLLARLNNQEALIQGLRQVIDSHQCQNEQAFLRLRAAGLVRREGEQILPRCELYAKYFRKHLHE